MGEVVDVRMRMSHNGIFRIDSKNGQKLAPREAVSVFVSMVWAGHSSTAWRGWCVTPPAQSLNVDRKPWGTGRSWCLRMSASSAISESWPLWLLGETCSTTCSRVACCLRRNVTALRDKGTRYYLLAFIRSAGMIHSAESKSISLHAMLRTSPERAAVSIRKHRARVLCSSIKAIFWYAVASSATSTTLSGLAKMCSS